MSEIEVRGKDIEEAVELGLKQLGLERDDVLIDIVDEGSKGFLGLGGREAVIRITPLKPPTRPQPAPAPKVAAPAAAPPPKPAPTPAAVEPPAPKPRAVEPATPQPPAPEVPVAVAIDDEDDDDDGDDGEGAGELSEEEVAAIVALVEEMLAKMQVSATLTTSYSEPDDMTGRRMLNVEIVGDDLAPIIGPRGEALNSLQYILRLMAGHALRRRANFMLDVGGYRGRRQQALTRLAERMAKKALQRRRPVTLEPMPPFERRIIHMALRGHDKVYTQSVGEGDRRKVRVYPNRKRSDNRR